MMLQFFYFLHVVSGNTLFFILIPRSSDLSPVVIQLLKSSTWFNSLILKYQMHVKVLSCHHNLCCFCKSMWEGDFCEDPREKDALLFGI